MICWRVPPLSAVGSECVGWAVGEAAATTGSSKFFLRQQVLTCLPRSCQASSPTAGGARGLPVASGSPIHVYTGGWEGDIPATSARKDASFRAASVGLLR